MICIKKLRFPTRPRAKVRRQGQLGSARAQPCFLLLVWFPPEILDVKDLPQYSGRFKKCRLLQSSVRPYLEFQFPSSDPLRSLVSLLDPPRAPTTARYFPYYYYYYYLFFYFIFILFLFFFLHNCHWNID